jgi:hypothetical protein
MTRLHRISIAALTVLILPFYVYATEVTPATSEDISDFDQHIEVSHNGAAQDAIKNNSERVAKEIVEFKKDKRMETEKSVGTSEIKKRNHQSQGDTDDVHSSRARDNDNGARDMAPRDKLPAPAKKETGNTKNR